MNWTETRQGLEKKLDEVYQLEAMFDMTVRWTPEIARSYGMLQETKKILLEQIHTIRTKVERLLPPLEEEDIVIIRPLSQVDLTDLLEYRVMSFMTDDDD